MYLTREVWPDDVFGADNMDVVEERDILKKIFLDPVSGELMCAYVCVCVFVCAYVSFNTVYLLYRVDVIWDRRCCTG